MTPFGMCLLSCCFKLLGLFKRTPQYQHILELEDIFSEIRMESSIKIHNMDSFCRLKIPTCCIKMATITNASYGFTDIKISDLFENLLVQTNMPILSRRTIFLSVLLF